LRKYGPCLISVLPSCRLGGGGGGGGGGGELALSHNLFLRAAFRYSDYGRVARGQKAAGMIDWRF
jgi:hypothetical protein